VSPGPTFRTFAFSGFPDGIGTVLDATAVGDSVTFTVNVAAAGVYDVKVSAKNYITRGTSRLSINGSNLGASMDQYAAADTFTIFDLGAYNFAVAGNYAFIFRVTGKNSSSSGYTISFDDITLTPQ
jgi:pectate lyase C